MNRILLLGAVALFTIPALPALAVPMCDGPDFNLVDGQDRPVYDEAGMAADYEQQLQAAGIDAHNTRWWDGCLQTFVRINGHDVMKFYDPNSLKEVPVN
jgi:hypothetical protein